MGELPSMFSGLLGGFSEQTSVNRARAAEEREKQFARDQEIFKMLAAHPNREIADPAAHAFLSMASGDYEPKNGLQRYLGVNRKQPHPKMQGIIDALRASAMPTSPQDVENTQAAAVQAHPQSAGMPTEPSKPGGGITTPPQARMPVPNIDPTAPDEPPEPGQTGLTGLPQVSVPLDDANEDPAAGPVGVPPPAVPQLTSRLSLKMPAPPPPMQTPRLAAPVMDVIGRQKAQASAAPSLQQTIARRQQEQQGRLILTPDQVAGNTRVATEQADVEGKYRGLLTAGFTPEEAQEMIKQEFASRVGGSNIAFQAVEGEIPDGKGGTIQTKAVFDRFAGAYRDLSGNILREFYPKQSSSSSSMGDYVERAAGELGYRNAADARTRGAMGAVNAKAAELMQQDNFSRTVGTNQAGAFKPLSPQDILSEEGRMRRDIESFLRGARVTIQQGQVIEEAYSQIATARAAGGSVGAQHQALVSSFAKIIDELSAVRTEEYNRTPDNQRAFDRIWGWWEQVRFGGAGIVDAEVDNIVGMARGIMQRREQFMAQQAYMTYRQATQHTQLDPLNIVSPDLLQMLQKYQALGGDTGRTVQTIGGTPGGQAGTPPPALQGAPPPAPAAALPAAAVSAAPAADPTMTVTPILDQGVFASPPPTTAPPPPPAAPSTAPTAAPTAAPTIDEGTARAMFRGQPAGVYTAPDGSRWQVTATGDVVKAAAGAAPRGRVVSAPPGPPVGAPARTPGAVTRQAPNVTVGDQRAARGELKAYTGPLPPRMKDGQPHGLVGGQTVPLHKSNGQWYY